MQIASELIFIFVIDVMAYFSKIFASLSCVELLVASC